jgi:hypothetical protein
MNTPPPQTLRADMNPSTRGNDRRQQTDRRRVSDRRETDQQPEESFQHDGDNDARRRETVLSSRPAGRALSEDEIRFLLVDD